MIHYRGGYKFQLTRDYELQTPVTPPGMLVHDFFTLYPNGIMSIRAGYAWDGASGPTPFDYKCSMRPSLVHDCMCQLMKERMLDYKRWSPTVHEFFRQLCVEDGMWRIHAAIWKAAVIFGRGGDPEIPDENLEQVAP